MIDTARIASVDRSVIVALLIIALLKVPLSVTVPPALPSAPVPPSSDRYASRLAWLGSQRAGTAWMSDWEERLVIRPSRIGLNDQHTIAAIATIRSTRVSPDGLTSPTSGARARRRCRRAR